MSNSVYYIKPLSVVYTINFKINNANNLLGDLEMRVKLQNSSELKADVRISDMTDMGDGDAQVEFVLVVQVKPISEGKTSLVKERKHIWIPIENLPQMEFKDDPAI